jgi:hypothetical protein
LSTLPVSVWLSAWLDRCAQSPFALGNAGIGKLLFDGSRKHELEHRVEYLGGQPLARERPLLDRSRGS